MMAAVYGVSPASTGAKPHDHPGAPQYAPAPPSSTGGASQEVVFFSDAAVRVSNASVYFAGNANVAPVTYALANVTSVRMFRAPKEAATVVLGALFCVIGIVVCLLAQVAYGVVAIALGVALVCAYIFVMKDKFFVQIGTSGAEHKATWSFDALWTGKVVDAINQAIVARG